MPNQFEPESYQDLFQMKKFRECQEVLFCTGWNLFLHLLQRYGEEISLLFAMGFNGRMDRVGHISFQVTEESIAHANKIPWEGKQWHKHWFVPWASHNFSLKIKFWYVTGIKGYHHTWIKPKYINPLTVIIHLVTCEGMSSVFKSCHPHYWPILWIIDVLIFYSFPSMSRNNVEPGSQKYPSPQK